MVVKTICAHSTDKCANMNYMPALHDNKTDENIVAIVTGGDVDAYGELMSRYEQKLLRYVVYLIHDHAMASDVVQDTFIKTYQNLNAFNTKYKFSSWIYRIAHNEAMNAVKKERHILHHLDAEYAAEVGYESSIVQDIDKAILQNDVRMCLEQLDIKYREVLMLQYYEQMKYSDIADILHIPVATVGVRVGRAKRKLRQLCEQKGVRHA